MKGSILYPSSKYFEKAKMEHFYYSIPRKNFKDSYLDLKHK